MADLHVTELDLCQAWTQLPRSLELRSTDGQVIEIVHLGAWTHGLGPDFRNAMVCFDGKDFQTGSVELHLRTRGWIEHGHNLDPRYNDVVLHVVTTADRVETRRQDGKLVPVVVLAANAHKSIHRTEDWSLVGGEVCAAHLAAESPAQLIVALESLGDERMSARSAQMEANLTRVPPDQVLYEAVLDALGYAANREPMRTLSERLPWPILSSIVAMSKVPADTAIAALLGASGFMPMSDSEFGHTGFAPERHAELTELWRSLSAKWALSAIPSTAWQLARVRPLNHPIRRLVQAALLFAHGQPGLTAALLRPIRHGDDSTRHLTEMVAVSGGPTLGEGRARAITTNVLIPFGFALASHSGDTILGERVAELWGSLKAGESNERTRRAIRQISGPVGLKQIGGRAHQGLIHLDQVLCGPRRCYQCPIGRLVVMIPTS